MLFLFLKVYYVNGEKKQWIYKQARTVDVIGEENLFMVVNNDE